eukprot:TRINITY_DN1996_c0_g1_i1.p1 TRINITY_DN1996_c0_g1~~TRINITY_DN1996_c0_g1_i1.p1  ORF type:complete len:386 (-),score=73.93 TRINITY_DN1996_c0_g1_i1:1000-2157(-)
MKWASFLLLCSLLCALLGPSFSQHTEENFDLGEDDVEEEVQLHDTKPFHQQVTESEIDDEDFEGFPEPTQKTETASEDQGNQTTTDVEPMNFFVEIIYAVFLAAYLFNYWQGKNYNQDLANRWYEEVKALLNDNFSNVYELIKESNYKFSTSTSGRINCVGLQAVLDLKKRHDLFSSFASFFVSSSDTLTIDIPLNEVTMDRFVFAIVRKKEEKQMKKDLLDLKYVGKHESPLLPPNFVILTDSDELIDQIIHKEVEMTLKKYAHLVQSIHVSDLNPFYAKYHKVIRFVFLLPQLDEMSSLDTLMRMTIHFIDLLRRIRISKQAKIKIDRDRTKIAQITIKEKEKERSEEKEEAKKKDVDPEVLRKRQERKMMKKHSPKFKVISA